jgi:hypothetical protein
MACRAIPRANGGTCSKRASASLVQIIAEPGGSGGEHFLLMDQIDYSQQAAN